MLKPTFFKPRSCLLLAVFSVLCLLIVGGGFYIQWTKMSGLVETDRRRKSVEIETLRDKVNALMTSRPNKNWEYLPDGRVVIEIKNEKLALLPDSPNYEKTYFHISDPARAILDPNSVSPSLAVVIGNPDLARALFELSGLQSVAVATPLEGLAQGKFDPKTIESSMHSPLYYQAGQVAYHIPGIVFYTSGTWNKIVSCDDPQRKPQLILDASGFYIAKNGSETYYCLPSEKRAFSTIRPLEILCSSFDACNARYYGKTEHSIEIGYGFNGKSFPLSDWRDFDRRMHEYLSYMVLTEELE